MRVLPECAFVVAGRPAALEATKYGAHAHMQRTQHSSSQTCRGPRGLDSPESPQPFSVWQTKAEGHPSKPKRLNKHQNMLEGFAHKYELNNPSGSCSEVVRVDRGVVQVSLGVVRVVLGAARVVR